MADQHIEKCRQDGGSDGQSGGYRGIFAGRRKKEYETDAGEHRYKAAKHDEVLHLPDIQTQQACRREQDLQRSLPAFPAEKAVGDDLEDSHAGDKSGDPDTQDCQNFNQCKSFAAVSGAAQDIVCTGLVFTAEQGSGDHHAQEHEQEEVDSFIFGHIGVVTWIVVEGCRNLFIHLHCGLLRIRIVLLLQTH